MKLKLPEEIIKKALGIFRVAAGLTLTLAIILSPWWLTSGRLSAVTSKIAQWSVERRIPAAPTPYSGSSVASGEVVTPTEAPVTTTALETAPPPTETTAPPPANTAPVREVKLGNDGTAYGNVFVRNANKKHGIDIADVLSQTPDCKIKLNAGYQVLIVHTHTTECYAPAASDVYDTTVSARTTDKAQNVVRVGDELAAQLEAVGIRTLHITTMHDYPAYNGSYNRAAETISDILAKYPSIEMVIDVHRDSMTQSDGTKLKPTAEINGKKAAQVMIISGCDDDGSLNFPNWRMNLKMGVKLQKQLADSYPGLARPLYFAPYRYNMHFTPNSLLIEFGTDVNTLEEAVYSGELVGKALSQVLLNYVV